MGRPPHLETGALALEARFPTHDREAWTAEATRLLKGRSPDRLVTRLPEGIDRPPLYLRADAPPVGDGGADAPPYRRGSRAADRRQAGWDVRAVADTGTAAQVRVALAADRACGARSVWIQPDRDGRGLPGDGGGALVRDAAQLGEALADLDLVATPVHLDVGLRPRAWVAAWREVLAARGVQPGEATGALACDPLGTLAAEGTLTAPLPAVWDRLAGAFEDTTDAPWMQLVGVSAVPFQAAGAHRAQALGLLLASGAEALRALTARGVDLSTVARRTLVQVAVEGDLFASLAFLRAVRVAWSALVRASGGDAEDQRAFVHAVVPSSGYATRDPWVNVLRGTAGVFSAATGGADAITQTPWDRPLGTPDARARRLAVTSQVVLEAEAHLARVVDPAGGSFYLEALTDALVRRGWEAFRGLERQGGLSAALQAGTVQDAIRQTRTEAEAAIATRRRAVLGVSVFPNPDEARPRRAPPPREHGELRAGAVTVERLEPWSPGAAWERLRDDADAAAARDRRPTVFLATLGPLPRHKARADFARQLFEAGGFAVVVHPGGDVPALVDDYVAQGDAVDGACICGTDEDYALSSPLLAERLRHAGARFVALAGRPDETTSAGITHAVYRGADVLGVLQALHDALEVGR